MHTAGASSRSRALSCAFVTTATTASRMCACVRRSFYYRECAVHMPPLHFAVFRPKRLTLSALTMPCRLHSSGLSQGTPTSTREGPTKRHPIDDHRKPASHTPAWVSTHKQNGEKRMSVSIRSGAQRQRARRPPNVPPHAPPPPPQSQSSSSSPYSVMHLSSVAQQGEGKMYSNHGSCATSSPHNGSSGPNATLPGAPPGSFSFVSGDVGSPLSSGGAGDAAESQLYRSPTPSSSPSAPEATTEIGIHGSASPRTAPQGDAAFVSGAAAAEAEGVRATMPLHSRESGAASSSSIYSASTSSSSHPLLYSVSRFTEPVKRIILIRNGRSEANEDVAAYVHTPDWRIPLVEEGKHESIAAGRALGELTGDDPVYFYYSPYIRSRQSLRYVLQGYDEARLSGRHHTREWWEEEEDVDGVEEGGSAARGDVGVAPYPESEAAVYGGLPLGATGIATTFAEEPSCRGGEVAGNNLTDLTTDINSASFLQKDSSLVLNSGTSDNIIGVREDVRLRDGDIGRYTTVEELMHHLLERERYGKFFYRFPFGESGADVCDRVTSFLDAFQRERVEFPMNTNVVIITHGLTMRMFIKRWFHLTVETFHRMKSPPPGSLCTLTRLHHRSCFRLDESCVELMHLPLSLNEYNGYKYRNKQLLGSMSSGAPYM